MIVDHDRSGWFGASDVRYIVGNRNTKSWTEWWLRKCSIITSSIRTDAMDAGTAYEHAILEYLGVEEMDKQLYVGDILLRVNLDGNDSDTIHEIKTYAVAKGFAKPPKHYVQQVNVQQYAWLRKYGYVPKAYIHAYGLTDKDYANFLRDIDGERLLHFPVQYDETFIRETFLPNISELADSLRGG